MSDSTDFTAATSPAARRMWWTLFVGTLAVVAAVVAWWVSTFEPIEPVWDAAAGDELRVEILAWRLGLDARDLGDAALHSDATVSFAIRDANVLDLLALRVSDLDTTRRVEPETKDAPFARMVVIAAGSASRHWGDLYTSGFVQLDERPPMAFAGLVELLGAARRAATAWTVRRDGSAAWEPLAEALAERARRAQGPVVHDSVRDLWLPSPSANAP